MDSNVLFLGRKFWGGAAPLESFKRETAISTQIEDSRNGRKELRSFGDKVFRFPDELNWISDMVAMEEQEEKRIENFVNRCYKVTELNSRLNLSKI